MFTPASRTPAALATASLDYEHLYAQAEAAFTHYHNGEAASIPFADLLTFQQEAQNAHRALHQVTNRLIHRVWTAMQEHWPEEAGFLEKRFFDRETMQRLAHQMNISEGHIYNVRKRALSRFTDTLVEIETMARRHQIERLLRRLDSTTYASLVGVEDLIETLTTLLCDKHAPPMVLLEGIGGIGKTSLADAVTRMLIAANHFGDVAWVSVQPQRLAPIGQLVPRAAAEPSVDGLLRLLVLQLLPAFPLSAETATAQLQQVLIERLNALPHLLVIDNLEALPDQAGLATLLDKLAPCARLLLTSRHTLPTMQTHYRLVVPPLAPAAAFALVRQEATMGNIPSLATATDEELAPLYTTVGGNPLALRLVTALSRHYDLASLLARLRQSGDQQTDQLYTFIFQQSWRTLDELGQRLLLYMPLAHRRGDTAAWIATATGLADDSVTNGLAQLAALNLVNVHADSPTYRYSIHQLTRSFLLNEAIRWRG